MKITDELMWEREVADYMRRYAGLLHDMSGAGARSAGRRAGRVLAPIALLMAVVLLALVTGWLIGWYIV